MLFRSFALEVFDPAGGHKTIWMTGDVGITRGQADSDSDATLKVTNADPGKYVGLVLQAVTFAGTQMNLKRMVVNADGTVAGVAEIMPCNKNT